MGVQMTKCAISWCKREAEEGEQYCFPCQEEMNEYANEEEFEELGDE